MRIIEIIPFLYPLGGAERLVINLTSSIAKRKEDEVLLISLYTKNKNKIVDELINRKDINIVFLDKKRGVDLKCSKRLKKVVNDFKPDVIHCHLDSLITVWLSKVFKKYKTFYTFHTLINENVVGNKRKPKNALYRFLFKKKRIVPIAISQIIKGSICNYYDLKNEMVPVAENGVPLENFSNSNKLSTRKYDFVFAGRFIDLKNPEIIIKAFLETKKEFENINLVMIGDGPLHSNCKKTYSEEGIIFTGFIEDVSEYFKNSKVLVLASSYEGNPMVINEAIASGCFVIATKVGGIPDVVKNDRNGVLIDFDDNVENSLVSKMKECMHNIKKIETMLEKESTINQSEVSIEKTLQKYMEIFAEERK